jgi:hypothetical protein
MAVQREETGLPRPVGEAFRQRVRAPLALGIYLVAYSAAGVLEWWNFPERRGDPAHPSWEVGVAIRLDSGRHAVDAGGTPALHYAVADTGCGIPRSWQRAIFDAFVQGDDGRSRQGGAGRGLAICTRPVVLMGGRIWVESEPSAGSRFHFTVPIAEPPATTPERRGEPTARLATGRDIG